MHFLYRTSHILWYISQGFLFKRYHSIFVGVTAEEVIRLLLNMEPTAEPQNMNAGRLNEMYESQRRQKLHRIFKAHLQGSCSKKKVAKHVCNNITQGRTVKTAHKYLKVRKIFGLFWPTEFYCPNDDQDISSFLGFPWHLSLQQLERVLCKLDRNLSWHKTYCLSFRKVVEVHVAIFKILLHWSKKNHAVSKKWKIFWKPISLEKKSNRQFSTAKKKKKNQALFQSK